MSSADPTRVFNHIVDVLNAAATWGGAVASGLRDANEIHAARIQSGTEILRAIASNPQNGFHGSLGALVAVNHNQFLPAHDGEPGIPQIVPFPTADAVAGEPASPSEIDSWRTAAGAALYTASGDGVTVLHDAADGSGRMSPVSARYAIDKGIFKFTGLSAQLPLIQLTRSMADSGVPDSYEPTIVKLSIPKLMKPGDAVWQIAMGYGNLGLQDISEIKNGAMVVNAVPDIEAAQKAGAA